MAGYLPFEDPDTGKLYKKILSCKYEVPEWFSNEARDLISKILNTEPNRRLSIDKIKAHPWYSQYKQSISDGILIGYSTIPINSNVLSKLEKYNFDLNYSQRCIEANKHNHITTAYYLLLKKYKEPISQPSSEQKLSIIQPNFMPAPPRMMAETNLKPRHRKYIGKKVESTGGSSSKGSEVLISRNTKPHKSQRASPKSIIKSIYTSIANRPTKRYMSNGRKPREPMAPKPDNISIFRRKPNFSSRHATPKKTNKSVDYGRRLLDESSRKHHRANSSLMTRRKTDRPYY